MNELQTFRNNMFGQVRATQRDGDVWFVAADVCKALEISNPTVALDRLDEDEKAKFNLGLRGGDTGCVNRYGLFALVLGSRKKEARLFKRWITHEVLPAIQDNGGYIAGQERMTDAEIMAKAILVAQATIQQREERIKALEAKVEADAPKVLLAETLENSEQCILVGQLAKILRQNGVDTGQQRLFKRLRNDGYLCKVRGERYNMPTQRSMEQGLFEIKERTLHNSDGSTRITLTPLITGKGQRVLTNRYIREAKPKQSVLDRIISTAR